MERITIRQDESSRFAIVHQTMDEQHVLEETFFGGFCNEVECPGTDDESFAWENESWLERIDDGAILFKDYQNAKDNFRAINLETRRHCSIVLYGKGDVESTINGSYWYPLKTFKEAELKWELS